MPRSVCACVFYLIMIEAHTSTFKFLVAKDIVSLFIVLMRSSLTNRQQESAMFCILRMIIIKNTKAY